MRNSWRHPAYLQKKSAVMERDGVNESVVEVLREIIRTVCCYLCESCIQILSASHILDISGGKGQLLVSSFCCLIYLFCCYEPDLWKLEHVAFIYLSDRATVRH